MDSPRSSHRCFTAAAESGDTTKSGSKISTPSNPAAAAATSLSSSVPEMQTVAIAVFGRVGVTCASAVDGTGAAEVDKTDMIAPRGRLTLRVTAHHRNSEHVRPPVPTSGRRSSSRGNGPTRREDEDMAPELPEALREVAERA